MRAVKSGLKTAAIVAVSGFLLQAIDVLVQNWVGYVPEWLKPWGPVLVPIAGIIKGLVKQWETKYIDTSQGG